MNQELVKPSGSADIIVHVDPTLTAIPSTGITPMIQNISIATPFEEMEVVQQPVDDISLTPANRLQDLPETNPIMPSPDILMKAHPPSSNNIAKDEIMTEAKSNILFLLFIFLVSGIPLLNAGASLILKGHFYSAFRCGSIVLEGAFPLIEYYLFC